MVLQRMCAVCRERREKSELLRIVRGTDGKISIDKSGKLSGRGAYICKKYECMQNAGKRRVLERSFSCRVDGDVYKELEEQSYDYKD